MSFNGVASAEPLVLEKFEEWLRGFSGENTIIGWANYSKRCPITNYLRTERGYLSAAVGRDSYILDEKYALFGPILDTMIPQTLPQWAQMFVRFVDNQGYQSISNSLALSFLEKVKASFVDDHNAHSM